MSAPAVVLGRAADVRAFAGDDVDELEWKSLHYNSNTILSFLELFLEYSNLHF